MSLLSLPRKLPFSLASVVFHMCLWAPVWLLRLFPRHFLCFRYLACVLIGRYFLSSFGFGLLFVLLRLLHGSVESRFLRDGVLPLGRVCSVGCGFSVCAVFAVFIRGLSSSSWAGFSASGFRPFWGFCWLYLGSFLVACLYSAYRTPILSSGTSLFFACLGIVYRAILPHLRFLFFGVWSPCPLWASSAGAPYRAMWSGFRTLSARHGLSVARPSIPWVSSVLLSLIRSLRSSLEVFLACFLSSGSSLAPWASCLLGTFPVVYLSALSGTLSQHRGSSGSLSSWVSFSGAVLFLFFLTTFRAQSGPSFVLFLALVFGQSLRVFFWLSSGRTPLVTCVSCSALPLSYCFSSFLSKLFLCFYTLSFSPSLSLPWVSSSGLS